MSLAFSHLSWWLWSLKHQEPKTLNTTTLVSSAESNPFDSENQNLKFPSLKGSNAASLSRRVRRKWQNREERKRIIDREYDVVLVPSDGGCVSGSESDGSDYSIGWLEPHGPEFGCIDDDDEADDGSFAVLVRCYGHNPEDAEAFLRNKFLGAVVNVPESHCDDGMKYMEQFLASLQNNELQKM